MTTSVVLPAARVKKAAMLAVNADLRRRRDNPSGNQDDAVERRMLLLESMAETVMKTGVHFSPAQAVVTVSLEDWALFRDHYPFD